jgi:hypothetical protein
MATLHCTKTAQPKRLRIRARTPANGVIFSEGIEADCLDFNAGTEAQISVAERQGQPVV